MLVSYVLAGSDSVGRGAAVDAEDVEAHRAGPGVGLPLDDGRRLAVRQRAPRHVGHRLQGRGQHDPLVAIVELGLDQGLDLKARRGFVRIEWWMRMERCKINS